MLLDVGVERLTNNQIAYLSVENQELEKRVHEKNSIGLNRRRVQKNWFRGSVEGVSIQNGLNHDETLGQILTIQTSSIERRLIRRIVEHLQELRTTQVEHELGIQGEIVGQTERVRIVLMVLSKFLALQLKHDLNESFGKHRIKGIGFIFYPRFIALNLA